MSTVLEVRPFKPTDLPLVHRLTSAGLSFDSATTLTRGIHTVEGAVWGVLPLADLGMPTLVLRDGDYGYVAQFRHKASEQHAHVVFIAPNLGHSRDEMAWLRLLEAMMVTAGRRGAVTLNAEIDEDSDAFVILREAGFSTYSRQDFWKSEAGSIPVALPGLWRPSTDLDAFGINSLYVYAVPRMVRQAEEPPDPRHGLVYERAGQIAGYLTIQEGKYGLFAQALFSAEIDSDEVDGILAAALATMPRADKLPVYFCVRRDQCWLNGALEALGFEPCASQAVMVRHTARHVEHYVHIPAYVPEGTRFVVPPVSDYYASFRGIDSSSL
jgi:hypothetical protein